MSVAGPVLQLGVIAAAVAGLWVGARLLVDAAVRLARGVGLSELTIGLTIVAAGTSLPELVVTTDAAVKGFGDIAVGNIVGSNIYNIAFILGVVSLLRVVPIERSLVHRDGVALVASTLLGVVVLLDGSVTRFEGAAFVGLYLAYTAYLLRTGGRSAEADPNEGAPTAEDSENAGDPAATTGATPDSGSSGGPVAALADRLAFRGRNAVFIVAGLALILVSGDLLVGAATELARGAGISEWVIGGTIVAAGTSTPEFAVSLVAMRGGQVGVSVGNVVGSNILNLLGILGLAATIRPLALAVTAPETLAWLVVVSVVLVAALWTGRKLSRVEGGLFALSEVVRWVLGLFGLIG